jgi:hypothetical protein
LRSPTLALALLANTNDLIYGFFHPFTTNRFTGLFAPFIVNDLGAMFVEIGE